MQNAKLKIVYENNNVLVVDKPPGIIVAPEKPTRQKTLIDLLLEKYPDLKNAGKAPRYGIVHRLDKDTSGILLIAKNNKALDFLQKQFKTGKVTKKYFALVVGNLKSNQGTIETLIGRAKSNRKKQKVYFLGVPEAKGKRLAITDYKVLRKFKKYTLIEVSPKTGRRHQIRCHFSYFNHPIAGDKTYGFKNQSCPEGLNRQFLHASYIKIQLPDRETKEFKSRLPEDLNRVLEKLGSEK